ncbi:MAG TPA: type II toxin-antitoxin system Phd/YefM family antitoxin [Thermoanaerobaculia bacterium]|nr:type II toxin-antitoxin system Phd/YefM family antitoxin [Thermoanaerobaculia bacterium]
MRKQQSIAEARKNLPQLVRDAEEGKAVELTRRGESVAVLLGRREYERLAMRSRRFSEAWNAFTREVDLRDLDIDPDEIFDDVRDTLPGRNVGL